MFFELRLDDIFLYMWFLHDLERSPLVIEQIRMDVHKLFLLFFGDFSKYVILPNIMYPRAVIGSPKIEYCFSNQKFLR